jgi:heterodisulfide reductase subunit A-like polyferredoxin
VWTGIKETDDNGLCVGYVDLATGLAMERVFDMVVLSSDVEPPACLAALATTLEINLAGSGYVELTSSTATSRDGIYAAGCATGPMGGEQSMEQARLAAMAALGHCSSQLDLIETKPEQSHSGWQDLPESEQCLRIEQLLKSLIVLGES